MTYLIKNIFVTAGADYIGIHILDALIKVNNKVIIVDNLVTSYKKLIFIIKNIFYFII